MFDLGHVSLLLLGAVIGAWLWRALGARDRALGMVRQHCERSDIQLLDDSIVLTKLRLGWNQRKRLGLIRRYGFEFTVTGERRYSGWIELHGLQLLKIELPPHPFPGGINEQPSQPSSNVHYLR